MQVFRYSISWILLLFPPTLTIMKLCNEDDISVKGLIGVSTNITMYIHGLIRTSVLFFGRRQMKYLIETTKQFWAMEDYEAIVRRTRKERITYTWITVSFVLVGCLKRHLNVRETGLYFPQWAPKHVQDLAQEWGLLSFISYDILFRTLLIQITIQLKMLNGRLLTLYDLKANDANITHAKFTEIVEHYVILIRCADGINKLFSKVFLGYTGKARDIMLIIIVTQKPFEISAGGIIPLNMQTLLAACKTMVSYCMFLRTVDGSTN
nr:unnamed protein product [Callosobruchus analis]